MHASGQGHEKIIAGVEKVKYVRAICASAINIDHWATQLRDRSACRKQARPTAHTANHPAAITYVIGSVTNRQQVVDWFQ